MEPSTGIAIAIVGGIVVLILFTVLVVRWNRKNRAAHPELENAKAWEIHRGRRRK